MLVMILLVLLASCSTTSSFEFKEPDICVGDINIRNNPRYLNALVGCGVIEGSLQIVLMDQALPGDYENMTFPKLREITGFFVLFRAANLTSLSYMFPNLAVIRGEKLLSNYALVIYEMFALQTIGLRSLLKINRGAVRIEKNPSICFVDNIEWSLILHPDWIENNFIRDNMAQSECVNVCPHSGGIDKCRKSLPHGGFASLCWDSENCQKVCPDRCPDSCNDQLKCCHDYCIGGCTGPTSANCTACRNYIHNRVCVNSCPDGTVLHNERECISLLDCPKGYIIFQQKCSPDCPLGYTREGVNSSVCIPCEGPCPKECEGLEIYSVANAEILEGCTHIRGSLSISLQAGKNTVRQLEKYLGLIEEIDGGLVIIKVSSLVSLSFFRSLKLIKGQEEYLEKKRYALYVMDNGNLQDLFREELNSEFNITNGRVFFHFNPKLCYSKISALWQRIGRSEPMEESDVSRNTNGDFVACYLQRMQVNIRVVPNVVAVKWIITDEMKANLGDERSLLGYVISWREAPFKNVSTTEGEEACGESLWDYIYHDTEEGTGMFLTELKPWTQYAIYVKSYTLSESNSGLYSDIHYFKTMEDKPSAPTHVSIEAKSPSQLMVRWKPPKSPNGNVTRYKIKWQRQPQETFGDVNFCEEKIPSLMPKSVIPAKGPEQKTNITLPSSTSCNIVNEAVPEEETTHNQITFENDLHNIIYVKRPQQSRKKREAVTDNPKGDVNSLDVGYSVNTTQPPYPVNSSLTVANPNTTSTTAAPTTKLFEKEVFMTEFLEINGLEHFVKYFIEVMACNGAACSDSSLVFGRTRPKENADNIVSDVNVSIAEQSFANHVILVIWEEPKSPNGVILRYEIEVTNVDQPEVVTTTPPSPTSGTPTVVTPEMESPSKIFCVSSSHYNSIHGHTISLQKTGNHTLRVRAVTLMGAGVWTNEAAINIPDLPIDEEAHTPSTLNHILVVVIIPSLIVVVAVMLFALLFIHWRYKKDQIQDGMLYASVNPDYFRQGDPYVLDDWEFPRNKLQIIRELGKGSFGMVYEGTATGITPGEEKTRVAVKSVQANANDHDRIEFLNEACVMKANKTYHVVQLLGVVSIGQPAYVIMEYMAQGDLRNWLRARRPENQHDLPLMERKSPPTFPEIIRMSAEIADGMSFLIVNKYVHRDLSARNCLVSEEGTCKVADFGLARDIYQSDYYRKEKGGMLPIRWMAPESVKDGVFTPSSDVWSYGILLWEITSLGEMPYQGLSNEGAGEFIKAGRVLNMPEGCPEKLQEIMVACWQYQEKLRPTFPDIISTLDSTELLPPSFADVSFYHSEDRNKEHRASSSLEELERLTASDHHEMNNYTNMNGKGAAKSGMLPMNGTIVGAHGHTPVTSPIGRCTEC